MSLRKTFGIIIISASELPDVRNKNSKMQVYAKVSVGNGKTKKTSPDKDTERDPSWNCSLSFTIEESDVNQEGVRVVIKLYCKGASFENDKYIGEVHKSLYELFNDADENNKSAKCDLPLKKGSVELTGRIYFSYRFQDGGVEKHRWWKKLGEKMFTNAVVHGTSAVIRYGLDNITGDNEDYPTFYRLEAPISPEEKTFPGSTKIVGVFYKANEYASMNPNFQGWVEGASIIQNWLKSKGHQYIAIDDKEGPDCELEKHIPNLHVLITTPFHPDYVTAEMIKKAKNLQLVLTAGIGSDHVDLKAAAAAGLTVAEVIESNAVSVAEDELMKILFLLREKLPQYHEFIKEELNAAAIAYRPYDLEGKIVGTVGAGRIGKLLLQRLKPFNCNLLYHDQIKMDPELENQTGAKFEEDLDSMLPKCDIIVINTPLTEKTKGMFDRDRIAKLKRGVLIVENAWGAIMDTKAVVDSCSSGQIAGYIGNAWCPQPAQKDLPWQPMLNQVWTPQFSGTSYAAQMGYADRVTGMLEGYLKGEDFPPQNYIVKKGELAASQYRLMGDDASSSKALKLDFTSEGENF